MNHSIPEWYATKLAQLKEDRANGYIGPREYAALKRQLDDDAGVTARRKSIAEDRAVDAHIDERRGC